MTQREQHITNTGRPDIQKVGHDYHRSQEYWQLIISIVPTLSSLVQPCGVVNDDKVGIATTLDVQWPKTRHSTALPSFEWGKTASWGRSLIHNDVIKWKHFPRYWPFVWGIHRWPVICTHKGQWRGALMFSMICAWINGSVNNSEAGDLRRRRAHYDVIVMWMYIFVDDLNSLRASDVCMHQYHSFR